jgi:ketosteroid isomerase-like protein
VTAATLGILAASLLGCHGTPPLRRFDNQADLADWVYMWNRREIAAVESMFSSKPSPTYYAPSSSDLQVGLDAIADLHRDQGFRHGAKGSGAVMRLENLHTHYLGDVTVVTGTWILEAASEESPGANQGPLTLVYRRDEDHTWRIVHAHQGLSKPEPPSETETPAAIPTTED